MHSFQQPTRREVEPRNALAVPDALLRIKAVEELIGMSRATIYRMVQSGRFCRPIRLNARCVRWRAGDVQAWLQSQAEAAHA